ncbi:MAG: P-II family nitrogen regulator [Actinomycetota bacterium]
MILSSRKLITIVAEAALENRLTQDLKAIGAKGYTVTPAHGTGPKNQRVGDMEGGNIRIEMVCSEELLEQVIELLKRNYLTNYACSFWVSDVQVLREERY